jgi:hypothetical protein
MWLQLVARGMGDAQRIEFRREPEQCVFSTLDVGRERVGFFRHHGDRDGSTWAIGPFKACRDRVE